MSGYIFQFKFRWLPTLLLGLFFLGALSVPLPSRAEPVDRIRAIVNDDIILLSDFETAIEEYQQILKDSGQSDGLQPLSKDQKWQLLNKMIDEKLVDQEAKRLGITIDDEDIDRTIEHIQKINKVSEEEMRRVFKLKGMTFEKYRSQIKEQLMQSRIVNREVKSKVVVTGEDIKAFYRSHQAQYAGQTKYHLRHILMRAASGSPNARESVYRQMQQVRERLQSGEPFAGLAKVYSQAASAQDGGDLGYFESRLLADNIRQAVTGTGPGEFTDIIETEQGYQIFYVEEIVQAGGKSLEEAKDEIHQKLSAEMTEKTFEKWFKALRQQAHIEILD